MCMQKRRADLHGQGVSSMAASIDDVEGRNWQDLQHHCTAQQTLNPTQQSQKWHCFLDHDELEACRASLVNVEQFDQSRNWQARKSPSYAVNGGCQDQEQ